MRLPLPLHPHDSPLRSMKIQKIFPLIFFVCCLSDSNGEQSVFDFFSDGEAKIFLNLAFYDRNEIVVYELYRSVRWSRLVGQLVVKGCI